LTTSKVEIKQKQFGWLITVALLLIATFQWYTLDSINIMLLPVSAGTLILSFVYPKSFSTLLYTWMWIGSIMSEISSFLILGIIYYLLFVPITILFRIKKKTPPSGWQQKSAAEQNYETLF
jgi:hypothetical protein